MELIPQHEELLEALRTRIYPWRKFTIGIDGRDGARKTNLARYLAYELDMSMIETDLLIIQDTPPPAYRYNDLARLVHARHSLDRPVIIEGVFLLHVLKTIDVACDFLIFAENEEYEGSEFLRGSLQSYEAEFGPRQKADYVFEWRIDR